MGDRERDEQAAAAWLLRQDNGPWSERDAAELETWLAQSAGHRAAYYRFKGAWQEVGRLQALLGQAGTAPEPVRAAAPPNVEVRTRRRRLPGLALAASVACVLGLAALVQLSWSRGDVYATRIGALEAVALPDGSRLTLNTDSRLRVDMAGDDRRVRLRQGEAFFEVAKDPTRPFVVEAGDTRIIAVGTAFSVRRDGDDVQVVVTEGRVRIETAGGPDEVLQAPLLEAGMAARTQGDAVLVRARSPVELAQDLSWRTGQLVFRDTPMAEAIAEFNRYNARKLVVEDPAVGALRVGGIFRATELDAFVSLIQQGFPVQARTEDDRIVLTARQ
ncbi:FecR family protein [Luteimonas sp. TWI1416]|uniref:FecR family protein n=1 Tax=unclassified Luteimonas TaxID=2629088 RepID=UPI00320A44F5